MADVTRARTSNLADPRMNRGFQPARIRFPDGEVDPSEVVLVYDRPSDTILLFLYGRQRRTVVIGVSDYCFMLVDPETDELVGVQIEDFLSRAVSDAPWIIELLDVAELRGISPDEVRRERHKALGQSGPSQPRADHEWAAPQHGASPRTYAVVQALLRDEWLGLPVSISLGPGRHQAAR